MTAIDSHGKRVTYNLWSYVTLFFACIEVFVGSGYVILGFSILRNRLPVSKETGRNGVDASQRFCCTATVFSGAASFGTFV